MSSASNQNVEWKEPIPTEETQELYNKWRQVEDRLVTPQALDQLPSGHSTSFLEPPSPSLATSMTRSHSYASTTHSITHAIQDMGVGDQPQLKRRPGRNGPLAEAKKRKAALVRKLGACPNCRERKVQVRRPASDALSS
jgi:hypothetical protein